VILVAEAFVLATANPHKAREIAEILGGHIELLPRPPEVPDVDETGDTLLDNARLKAQALVAATARPAIADDTGLEVDALGGAPGVRSARYAGEEADDAANVAKLLAALADLEATEGLGKGGPDARRARFRTVAVAAWPGGAEEVAEGTAEGWIATERRGEGGFGYDVVFIPTEGWGATFAEMTAEQKHAMSHRGRAFRALAERIGDRVGGA
jgi:XTP/dITP diphosphohydrolase